MIEVTKNLTQVTIASAGVAGVNGTSGTSGTFGNVLSSSFYISGSIIPNVADGESTSSFSLGSSTNAWKDLWISDGTIYFVGKNSETQSISLNENNEIEINEINLNSGSFGYLKLKTTGSNQLVLNEGTILFENISGSNNGEIEATNSQLRIWAGSLQEGVNNELYLYGNTVYLRGDSGINILGSISSYDNSGIFVNDKLHINSSLTASLSQGYMWVGGAGNVATLITTSSLVTTGSGSSGTSGTAGTSGTSAEGTSGTSGTSFSASLNLESINTFTSSIELRVISLEYSASISITGSNGTSGTSGVSGSSGTSGVSGTFGFSIDSGSFATTGSNQFNGNQTITGSLIQGLGNIATGENSHAEGDSTQAIGNFSHAEGLGTIAYGDRSHAEGQDTIASASYSHAEGNQTIALGNHQHVQGQYNAASSVPAAFIVGNGTDSENRSNLIHAAGNEVQITGSLNVTGSVNIDNLIKLTPVTNFPSGQAGMLVASASYGKTNLYVYDGSNWKWLVTGSIA